MTAEHIYCAGCEDGMPWFGLPCPNCKCEACERGRAHTDPGPLKSVSFAGEIVWHAMLGLEPPWGEVFADGANGVDCVELRPAYAAVLALQTNPASAGSHPEPPNDPPWER